MKTKVTALCEFRFGKPEAVKPQEGRKTRPKAKYVIPAGTVFEYEGDEKSLAKLISKGSLRTPTEAELALDAMRSGGGSRSRTVRSAPPTPGRGRGSKPEEDAGEAGGNLIG